MHACPARGTTQRHWARDCSSTSSPAVCSSRRGSPTTRTARPASQSRQHWFTLQGDLAQARDGRVDAHIVQTTDGGFDFLPTYNANVVGIATLTVLGCDRATLDYRFTDPLISGPFADRSGRLALTRMGDRAP